MRTSTANGVSDAANRLAKGICYTAEKTLSVTSARPDLP